MKIKIGILTLSDRASDGVYEDRSGIAIKEILNEWITNEIEYFYKVIPDDYDLIVENLIKMCDSDNCDLVVTTGGTGPALRDVTPEATEKVCEKMMPGFGELMRMESLKYVPTAILSRQTAGIRGKSFIINLPGNPKAIKECLEPVFPAIPYCIDLIEGGYIKTDESKMKVFRPKQKPKH
ncbi:molybdopterin adenylyltransferase [Campylobacter blaseri]|uniref:Molybdopterin adenylyltransferase n=1 Tax=Campylobacter blaseri TaxID=2042961 RepID=A0A2P8R2F0_9BACT|nr:molybdopterin adenylyltransferase [Campylobacter blaseri]PSM54307.1 molybdopterin adenylyltransferase [Campylobacter blaseri]QKF85958.1 molybdopterin adenylyltransferase [Campylobacter blaseri]